MTAPPNSSPLPSLYIIGSTNELFSLLTDSNSFTEFAVIKGDFSQAISLDQKSRDFQYCLIIDPRFLDDNLSSVDLYQFIKSLIPRIRRTVLITSDEQSLLKQNHLNALGNSLQVLVIQPSDKTCLNSLSNREAESRNISSRDIRSAYDQVIFESLSTAKKILLSFPGSTNIHYYSFKSKPSSILPQSQPNALDGKYPQNTYTATAHISSTVSSAPNPKKTVLDKKKLLVDKQPKRISVKKIFSLPFLKICITSLLLLAMVSLTATTPLLAMWLTSYLHAKALVSPDTSLKAIEFMLPIVKTQSQFLKVYFPNESIKYLSWSQNLSDNVSYSSASDKLQYSAKNLLTYAVGESEANVSEYLNQSLSYLRQLRLLETSRKSNQESTTSLKMLEGLLILYKQVLAKSDSQIAIVVLNDAEQRSSGGFIQAVGITKLSRGVLGSIEWYLPNNLDQKTNGQVVPPDDLKSVLNTQTWYIRDANWSVSTAESNAQINWFLEKQLKSIPDYTIAINTSFLKSLLDSEPILVGESAIDSAALYELLAKEAIGELEAVSKPLLAEIVDNYLARVRQQAKTDSFTLPAKLISNLLEHNLQLYSPDPVVAGLLKQYRLDGPIPDINCDDTFKYCTPDVLYVVDSNIGINQVNPYIHSTHSYSLKLEPTIANHVYQLNSTNQAPHNDFPLGTYQSYLRFVIPKNAKDISLEVNQRKITSESWYIETTEKYKIIGIKRTVPVSQSHQASISFSTVIAQNQPYYELIIGDQPGNGSPDVNLMFDPGNLKTMISINGESTETSAVRSLRGNLSVKVAF
jgi:hypothetical protein